MLPPRVERRQREGASTVSLNHLLAAISGSKEKECANCSIYS
jgi:hypothetical protein